MSVPNNDGNPLFSAPHEKEAAPPCRTGFTKGGLPTKGMGKVKAAPLL